MVFFFILGIIALNLVLLFIIIRHVLFMQKMKYVFDKHNIIVFGHKSSGKDLIINKMVNIRNEPYYSNMSYTKNNENFMPIEIKDLSLSPNTPLNFINGEIEKIPHTLMESCNTYYSDMGIYLPNYLDSKLYVKFPSLPLFYPLSSQLYDMNIIFNTQDINRGWKALREQADYFIWTKNTIKLFGFLITKCYLYEKYETAQQKLLPLKTRLLNKYSRAEVDLYYAKNGEIICGHVIQKIKNIHYDSRYFEKMILKGPRIKNYKKEKSRRQGS